MTATCCVNSYDIGNIVRLSAAFTNISGTPTDPSTITLSIRLPDLTTVSFTSTGGQLTRTGTGNYYYDYTPTESGKYNYRYAGTGVCTATADSSFNITASPFV